MILKWFSSHDFTRPDLARVCLETKLSKSFAKGLKSKSSRNPGEMIMTDDQPRLSLVAYDDAEIESLYEQP